MPMTSSLEEFAGEADAVNEKKAATWQRAENFKQRFLQSDTSNLRLYGVSSFGTEAYSWDYGKISDYFINFTRLLDNDTESEAMRQFYRSPKSADVSEGELIIENSILINCDITSGHIKNSILVDVKADHIDATHTADCDLRNALEAHVFFEGFKPYDARNQHFNTLLSYLFDNAHISGRFFGLFNRFNSLTNASGWVFNPVTTAPLSGCLDIILAKGLIRTP